MPSLSVTQTIQLNFGPPRYRVQSFAFPRKSGELTMNVREGSQFLGIDAPAHDPENVYFSWAIIQNDSDLFEAKFRIVYDDEDFGAEEEVEEFELSDETILQQRCPGFFPIGTWTEKTEEAGITVYRRGHVIGYEEVSNPADGDEGDTDESTKE